MMTLEQLAYEISEEALSHKGAVASRLMDVAVKIREMSHLTSREAKGDAADVLHAMDQADTALAVAGLDEDDIFRRELRVARDYVAAQEAAKPVGEFPELENCVQVTKCCGREECGCECGNEWNGMVVRPVVPEGYVLMPIEPTIEMLDAYNDTLVEQGRIGPGASEKAYAALIAASQEGSK